MSGVLHCRHGRSGRYVLKPRATVVVHRDQARLNCLICLQRHIDKQEIARRVHVSVSSVDPFFRIAGASLPHDRLPRMTEDLYDRIDGAITSITDDRGGMCASSGATEAGLAELAHYLEGWS